ncbi:hypothetical protein JG687_00006923 [Phytophthora cactorum]|uniref:Uncharacterized protein n=1 Tax=Phytophthora cactorum TaxID=29920 RepID=A0A8T1UGK9_9STRA|nr:hypothetical protein JG687_00006923 [Phytophthora cactorum]
MMNHRDCAFEHCVAYRYMYCDEIHLDANLFPKNGPIVQYPQKHEAKQSPQQPPGILNISCVSFRAMQSHIAGPKPPVKMSN